MYRITIYNDSTPLVIHGERCKVANASIAETVNEIASLSFDVNALNPGYELLRPLSTTVEVARASDGSVAFEGRVVMPVPSMGEDGMVAKSVTCEHVAAYLLDSTQPYAEERQWESPLAFCEHVLAVHNAAMPERKRVHPGVIDMQTYETSDGLYCGIQRGSTWSALQEKLVKAFGGEMRVRRGGDGLLYLDYRERLGETRATRIQLGRNMKSARREVNPNEVVTRLYPYGAKLTETRTDENGNEVEVELEERLTIESANDGVPYIDDAVAIGEYGVIEGHMEWDDVHGPEALLSKAREWLGRNNAMPVSTTVTALDLEKLGLDADGFELHDWYPCQNPLIGLDEELEVVRISRGVSDPSQVSFDLGETTELASRKLASVGALSQQVESVRSQSATSIKNVQSSVRATNASLAVMEDRISSKVSETVTTVVSTEVERQVSELDAEAEQTRADLTSRADGLQAGLDEANGSIGDVQADLDAAKDEIAGQIGATNSAVEDIRGEQAEVYEIVSQNSQKITELLQTAEGWDFTFQEIQTTVNHLNDEYFTTYEEQVKYIRFVDGVIWLGREVEQGETDLKLSISNERMSFLQDNVEVAYITGRRLYITDARVTSSLELGGFRWAIRPNGNMGLMWIGGDS